MLMVFERRFTIRENNGIFRREILDPGDFPVMA